MSGSPRSSGADDFAQRVQQQLRRAQEEGPQAPTEAPPGTTAEEAQTQSGGPVGQGEHVVRQGECISSIAKDTGHFWETIWNDGGNTELRETRQDPNVLLPEDRVTVPEKRRKDEPIAAEQRHRFVRRGEPSFLPIKVLGADGPRANEPYEITIDGKTTSGVLDAEGKLEAKIPGNARTAELKVGQDVYRLKLGGVDPITEVSGIQARLNNLGFDCGPVDGKLGPRTRGALNLFRAQVGLPQSDDLDEATRQKLDEQHDDMRAGAESEEETDTDDPEIENVDPEDRPEDHWEEEEEDVDDESASST
ncbi:MAG: peptidoglycan-binding protein [Phycisphaerae bacterium]